MRITMAVVLACLVLGTASAGATDIAGKWGIGAAVFGGGGEVSLIHGHSARSAWLFDILIAQASNDEKVESVPAAPNQTANHTVVDLLAGPGYRRFTRPSDAFSPYWDIRVRGAYTRSRRTSSAQQTNTVTSEGVRGEFSFGLEYFTSWHFSVAAHTGLAQAEWKHTAREDASPSSTTRRTADSVISSIGLSPVLYVRAYF